MMRRRTKDRHKTIRTDIREAIRLVARKCPRLKAACYWAGTACIATEELAHRLLGWTDQSIRKDLAAYRDVDPKDAVEARDLILGLIRPAG